MSRLREMPLMTTAAVVVQMLMLMMMMMVMFIPGLSCAYSDMSQAPLINNRPIIGILAEDTSSQYGKTFVPAAYVKFLEQAGARVVPIRGGQPESYYTEMVNYTNGILIPGGAVNFATSLIGRSAKFVYNRALELNKKGDYYPVWGTCMGFQILCYITQGENLLKPTDSSNITWPLQFSPGYMSSRMYGSAPPEILKILATENVTQNEHNYSILLPVFENSNLSRFFNKLSTNKDRNGVEFISSVEAKDYPIYGVQWHPEKNNFNWNPNYVINHSANAVQVGEYMARFFVSEARKSQHKFPSIQDEADNLIQNYPRVYFNDGSFFENYYIDLQQQG